MERGLIRNLYLLATEDEGEIMNEPTIETLARRLDRVERENRWLKMVGVVALAMMVAVVLMGQLPQTAPNKTVEAQRFVVLDASGNKRAVLGNVEEKGTFLVFRGSDGKDQIALRSFGDARALVLSDSTGADRTVLGVLPNGATTFGMADQSGNGRAALTLEADGSIALALYDENSKSHVKLVAGRDGNPGIVLQDKAKDVRMRLLLYSDGSPAMVLFDNNGKVIWSAP